MLAAATPLVPKKLATFLFLCVPARLLLVMIAWLATRSVQKQYWVVIIVAIAFGFLPAVGFGRRFLTSSPNDPGAVFGDPAWWHPLRAFHAATFLAFGILALMRIRWAWVVLLVDVAVGMSAFGVAYR